MRIYDNLTPALEYILMNWPRGYQCWISPGALPRETAERILINKWPAAYETGLPPWKRQRRKQRRIPNALAIAAPVVGMPGHLQLILLATKDALNAPPESPFSKERWNTRCPSLSDYEMVHAPRNTGRYGWTWRLNEPTTKGIKHRMTALISAGEASTLRHETTSWVRFYCMFGGVRRQLRALLLSGRKHWSRKYNSAWPGFDPDSLPVMIGFRGEPQK
jgi:hypothetical protein